MASNIAIKCAGAEVTLPQADLRQLERLLKKGRHAVRVIKRAQILLGLHRKKPVAVMAVIIRTTPKTRYNTLRAYRKAGLEYALHDLPRPGRRPALSPAQDAQIVALACSCPPPGRARWTIQLLMTMAKKKKIILQVGREAVRNLLENHALKPWREKMW